MSDNENKLTVIRDENPTSETDAKVVNITPTTIPLFLQQKLPRKRVSLKAMRKIRTSIEELSNGAPSSTAPDFDSLEP